jgi:hypothetical protein
MFQTKVVEKIKTLILYSVTFFENRAVYELMWKNSVDPKRSQMTIWRVRILRWVPQAINTHLCNTYCFSTATLGALISLMLRYTYNVCCSELL